MANTYNAANKYFDIDTSVNVAGLTAVKGSAPDSADYCFTFNNATVTVESNLNLRSFYFGDNWAGTAATKRGHLAVNAGVTLTLYDTYTNWGLNGEGTSNTMRFNGTEASPVTVIGNTAGKVNQYNHAASKITASWTTFRGFNCIAMGAAHDIRNCTFDNCTYAIYWGDTCQALPGAFDGNTFIDCTYSLYDGITTTAKFVDLADLMARFPMKFISAGGSGNRNFLLKAMADGNTRYFTGLQTQAPARIQKSLRNGFGGWRRCET